MSANTKSNPTIFVIFGGTVDLTSRKIAPALYNLFLDGWLPDKFAIIGSGRTKLTDEQFRDNLLNDINQFSRSGKAAKAKWADFSANIFYQAADVKDAETYKEFGKLIDKHNTEWKTQANVIYYLAVSPNLFPIIASNISKAKLAEDKLKTRIVIEKPFGHDLESAKELNKLLSDIFDECQIYRIDHYLGKEHVQISVTEQLGVEDRGDYYDGAGALRDMIQNHLLQILCFIAMEPPTSFNADEIRDRKVDVLRAMRKFSPDDVRMSAVRGQYGKGWMEGKEVLGYREEPNVAPDSNTETFAAIKFFVDNWRWQGVPFYMRTGKRMHQT